MPPFHHIDGSEETKSSPISSSQEQKESEPKTDAEGGGSDRKETAVSPSEEEKSNSKDPVANEKQPENKKVTEEEVVEYLREMGLKNVANDLIKVIDHLKQMDATNKQEGTTATASK